MTWQESREWAEQCFDVRPHTGGRGPHRAEPCVECGHVWWALCMDEALEMCGGCSRIRKVEADG